jgi:hypothetical protein
MRAKRRFMKGFVRGKKLWCPTGFEPRRGSKPWNLYFSLRIALFGKISDDFS